MKIRHLTYHRPYNNVTNQFRFRVTIVAACQMYLESFPMDIQECTLRIESCK